MRARHPRRAANPSGRCGAAFAALLLAAAALATALEVPFLSGRVVDQAGILDPADEAALDERLAALERETGAQVAVLTLRELGDEDLEGYALRVAETWQLGRRDIDDGVLLLVAVNDRKMRLEVGYGLEASLPDLLAKRILDEVVAPRFRRGDFAAGIRDGVDAVATAIRGGDPLPPPPPGGDRPSTPLGSVMLIGFLAFMAPFVLSALFTKGCGGWFLYLFLTPFFAAFPFAMLGPRAAVPIVLAWLAFFPLLRLWLGRHPAGKQFRRRHPGLTRWGGMATGGGRSGGFSGGGFSGGGGSFGGGGASSSW
ncbi:MAG TPA: TPM domain-containing protein [Thermoanaerobaculia bacterium]|nr:TPM domain-containing protein [Thermoanaerobaculia bacterium]